MLELLMTFGPAKFEDLTVIPHELNAMAWIQRPRAEATAVYPHDVMPDLSRRS